MPLALNRAVEAGMKPYLLMLCGAFAFSLMGIFTHAAARVFDWQVIALARSGTALVLALALATAAGTPLVFLRPRTLWIRSIAGSLSVLCNFFALAHMNVADALALTNMFPVWIAVLSWPVLGRVPGRDVWLSVGCAMAGVALMLKPTGEGGLGTLLAATGSVTSAVALMGLHRLRHIAANAVVVHFSAVSVVILTGLWLIVPATRPLQTLPDQLLSDGWLLLGVGLGATVGQLMLTKAFAVGAPARVSIVALSQVVFAMVIESLLWQRTYDPMTLTGILMVLGPTGWMLLRRPLREESAE
ncbi:MAG TPA: EamA/RhaT family transporter [Planctomycetaceae bacterium]|jgi:drug/metabolite transporter (DMT)-like permease|nr:EamA/RhaT family transporter [Planctomycetaceae bacterium]